MSIKENDWSSWAAPRHRGVFVISLDFELYWGVRHLPLVAKYLGNLRGARAAVVALLKLFAEYEIHATWATVGFLFCDGTGALQEFATTLDRVEDQIAQFSLEARHRPPSLRQCFVPR